MNRFDNNYNLTQVIGLIRQYLDSKECREVYLPCIAPSLIPESSIEVISASVNNLEQDIEHYLTPSPELMIKKVIVGDPRDCYYIGPAFRNNEPESRLHNPQFCMLEWYKMDGGYTQFIDDVVELFSYVQSQLGLSNINFKNIKKFSLQDAFSKFAGIDNVFDQESFIASAFEKGYNTEGFDYIDVFSQVLANEVEPTLKECDVAVLYDYPMPMASLARANKDGLTAQRFEMYIKGVEIGNCFRELNDAEEQKARFDEEQEIRKKTEMKEVAADWEFVDKIGGLPDCTGIAIGVERLAMMILGLDSIDEFKVW